MYLALKLNKTYAIQAYIIFENVKFKGMPNKNQK
jgi:hypothetical protein